MMWVVVLALCGVVAGAADKKRLTIDGREFTIDQKDFKVGKFTMYGQEFDDTYGFVDASYLPLNNHGYAEVVEQCDFEADSIPLHKYSEFGTVNYYRNSKDYDAYKGYDWVPENKPNYSPGSDYFGLKDNKDARVMMQRCRLPTQADGSTWHAQRIGPMISTGGYDWWQLGFPDIGIFSEAFAKHPEGIDVIQQIFVPVTKNGTRLNYPPLHTHHIHSLAPNGVRPRLNPRPLCIGRSGLPSTYLDNLMTETRCANMSFTFEQHGDYICQPEDDGMDCLTQGDKSPRRLSHPLDFEGEINDVRPVNSEPLEWYYFVAMRWKPADFSEPPISQYVTMSPGQLFPPQQLTRSFTTPTPTHAETLHFFAAKIEATGELIRLKMHAHAAVFGTAMMLVGRPEDFGLQGPKFIPPHSYTPFITTELGFRDNEDLAQYILFHMKQSQDTYDAQCVQSSPNRLRNPICQRQRPDWICGSEVDLATAVFDGVEYEFDRRPKTWCKRWTFKFGDDYIALALNRPILKPPSPAAPGIIPPLAAQHLTFFFSYIDRNSGFTQTSLVMHTHDGKFHNFQDKLSPPELLSKIAMTMLSVGPPVFASSLTYAAWIATFVLTFLAVSTGYLVVFLARKVKAVDQAIVGAWEQLLKVITTQLPQVAVLTSAWNKETTVHKYEMVSLSDGDDTDLNNE